MPSSIFSRLRRPVRRQPTEPPPQVSPLQEDPTPQLQIDRRILQDPSALLDAQARDTLPRGLTPSTRLSSVGARSRPKLADSTGSSLDISPRTPSGPTTSRISKIASGGEWSTFGRKRRYRVPDVRTSPDDFKGPSHSPSPTHDKHLSAASSPSTYTLSRPSTHERHSSPRHSPDIRFSSKRSSPTDTVSSKRYPHTPQTSRSYTAPVAPHATSSATNFMTPVNREPALDSPHTFGHPTPDTSMDFSVAHPSPSPPPPLPPLDHPELAAVLSSRKGSTSNPLRDRSNTLPTHRRTPRRGDLFASLSFKLRRPVRPRSSLHLGMAETEPPQVGRRRARTISASPQQRRSSADWSSYQATVGVTSHANQAWPAEVSREMVRLCTSPLPGSSETRGRNPDPTHRPNRGPVSPSFLPFPRPDPPPPSSASATLSDRRVIIPVRPRSLQFSLGNHRAGEQPTARPSMTDVKRSLSAVEARHSPKNGTNRATYASSGLSDPTGPAPSNKAHRAPRPTSALARSQSLHPVSPTTPMASSAQGEPSTPTPAPRHLSDKSRGKRKAEDNIDLTPPEQKKEGQRATFLLPESRSQRISNSSHAPSSYHRKRARLSSSSPFATPVQSRTPSVQETPRSASRNHHFTSLSSSTGARVAPPRTPSRAASTRSRQPPTPSTTRRHERHQSMSQVSIPISAIVSPHAPSISRSTKFHMRDPRRPPKKLDDTPWGLRFATEDEPGSPIQAWCFFFGFLLFPVWWIAGLFLGVPRTRIAGDIEAEKGVTIDDPQIEHDATTWRFRCRVMAVVSLFTYVPFIVLVAIFAPR